MSMHPNCEQLALVITSEHGSSTLANLRIYLVVHSEAIDLIELTRPIDSIWLNSVQLNSRLVVLARIAYNLQLSLTIVQL
jgi:hypothetical protein